MSSLMSRRRIIWQQGTQGQSPASVARLPRRAFIWLHDDEEGVTTVEYAIMLILIAIAVAAFGVGLSGSVTGVFSRLISTLAQAS